MIKKKKLVIFSLYYKIMEIFRGLEEGKWKATTGYVSWGEPDQPKHGVNINSPFIIVDEDRDIKTIEEPEIVDFMLSVVFDEYSKVCEDHILSGFHSETTDAQYGFTIKDQSNLTQQLLLLSLNSASDPVKWKTDDKGVIELTKEQFINVCREGEEHKRNKMNEYWSLKEHLISTVKTYKEFDQLESYDEEIKKMIKFNKENA